MENNPQFFLNDDDEQSTSGIDPGLISHIRNALAKTSVGPLLTSLSGGTNEKVPFTFGRGPSEQKTSLPSSAVVTPTSRRFGHARSVSLADVKRIVSKITLSGRRSRSGSQTGLLPALGPSAPPHITRRRAHTVSSGAPPVLHNLESTPPLTPDSFSPASSHNSDWMFLESTPKSRNHPNLNNTPPRTREESQQIREGKRPQRDLVCSPSCYMHIYLLTILDFEAIRRTSCRYCSRLDSQYTANPTANSTQRK